MLMMAAVARNGAYEYANEALRGLIRIDPVTRRDSIYHRDEYS